MIMVAIIIWLLWRCCGGPGGGGQCDGIGASGAGPVQNTIVYVPVLPPLADTDIIPINKPESSNPPTHPRIKDRGTVEVLPPHRAPKSPYQFDTHPDFEQQFGHGSGFYNAPGSPREPVVKVSAPVTLYLFVVAIATIIVLRLFRK